MLILMLASHNSLTGSPVKFGLLRPFNFLSKCQTLTLEEQHAAGVRIFDLRVAKWGDDWFGAHGAQLYGIRIYEALFTLRNLAKEDDPIYFRIICEDTFYRGSCIQELITLVNGFLRDFGLPYLRPLYVRSKRCWDLVREYEHNQECADFPDLWETKYTRKGMADAVQKLYELKTTDDKLNLVACYTSKFIPFLSAKILTKIALKKPWKNNDVPVIDFVEPQILTV